ncbi:helix-turn-helix domain-containing protein [Coleofasciculus sp. FACHB-SPT36]|uniref:helix-turn-helix domain-containing protein n=1 Tax=Cyanophyceae TaxID=3028117 RepID=UPI00168BAA6B|nr:helix-turn-helix domain-containing protein [Coleofasciculus sp. FACHB-SPT36]MBD2538645.1 helix-turn-helix domain-containing protein [Coleofasciculus sp. FACHB-SPT36]
MSSQPTRQQVLELHNQMFISPEDFSFRWGIGYEELAEICAISKSTTYHWLGGQASRREAGLPYQRIMAMADFLLTNAERVQPLLERWHTKQ